MSGGFEKNQDYNVLHICGHINKDCMAQWLMLHFSPEPHPSRSLVQSLPMHIFFEPLCGRSQTLVTSHEAQKPTVKEICSFYSSWVMLVGS